MSGKVGTLYGIGIGPGDPEMLTLKGYRLLRSVPNVYVPIPRPDARSYAEEIAHCHLDRERQRVIELVFAMRHGEQEQVAQWRANAALIADHLLTGEDAAFLTEGDPLLYSTFTHIAGALAERWPELPVVTVPGISSFQAAAAAASIPLADRDQRLAILPATYEGAMLRSTLQAFDTVVLLKVANAFDQVLDILEELGLVKYAVYVRRCGRPEQEIVRDIRSLHGRELDYFSLLIVRNRRG